MPHLNPMRACIFLCFIWASPVVADDIRCTMSDGTLVGFSIDRNQFVAPHAQGEPPRRKITQVTYGAMRFVAEPFLIGDIRGFFAEGLGGSRVMFSVAPDGSAISAHPRSGERLTGACVDR